MGETMKRTWNDMMAGGYVSVWIPRLVTSTFSGFFFFFFFFARVNSNLTWVHCSRTVWYCSCTVHVLKNIKNGSHDTIYTIKNYFATVFSVFSNNKLNPNGPYVVGLVEYICLTTSFLSGFDFIGSKWIWGYIFGFK